MSNDTTPDPRTMTRAPDEPEFVQPGSDIHGTQAHQRVPEAVRPGAREIRERPELPANPERTAADIEDEETDPVGSGTPADPHRFRSDSELQRG
ncbi:hypothetical protein WG922_02480 [Ramlibacter sp. AN1015]|uniref:hypothetical protein n=1 Tax=Ramlibacter sp. AN1015 TaxID=3133428 RepID=UPI0030C1B502